MLRKETEELMDTDNSMVIVWEKGLGEGGKGYGGINGDGQRLDLGW